MRSGHLNVYYQNVRGLRTKFADFMQNVSISLYDVILITETWLDDSIGDLELQMRDFNLYRTDRSSLTSEKTRGGGCFLAVRKIFPVRCVPRVPVSVEDVSVIVNIGCQKFLFATAYIPPQAPAYIYEYHSENIEAAVDQFEPDRIFIVGDYNLPSTV